MHYKHSFRGLLHTTSIYMCVCIFQKYYYCNTVCVYVATADSGGGGFSDQEEL